MSEQHETDSLPTIVVTKADFDTLSGLAEAVEERLPDAASVLQSEMDRARVVSPDAVPADVVRMGSTVEFRADNGQQRTVTLVFPGDADIAEGKISILTPIGTALIGLSPGQSISWAARDGRRQRLTVLKVEQPASADV
ncbi:MAG: nucleoside diphosphate kinase regulator [Hyphomicrobiaceae bacterium]